MRGYQNGPNLRPSPRKENTTNLGLFEVIVEAVSPFFATKTSFPLTAGY